MNGEIRALDAKLSGKIDGMEAKMDGEFKTVHSEIRRLDEKIDGLDKRMDIARRLVAAEGKVRELESRKQSSLKIYHSPFMLTTPMSGYVG